MIAKVIFTMILVASGSWMMILRNKRKFNRRNDRGVEQFSSYKEKVAATAFDTILWWVGLIVLMSGLILLAVIGAPFLGWAAILPILFLLVIVNREIRKLF